MQILNSKAYYLKNYSTRTRAKSTSKHSRSITEAPQQKPKKSLNDIMRIRNINKLPRLNSEIQTCFTNLTNNHFNKRQTVRITKDNTNLYQKQRSILVKLLKKEKQTKQKKRSLSVNTDYVVIENHPLADIQTFEFQSMKPTDRYFHQMENIRLAQRLLLAEPSNEVCKKSLKKFYKQQQKYKSNISKLSHSRQDKRQLSSKKKLLHRQKWLD